MKAKNVVIPQKGICILRMLYKITGRSPRFSEHQYYDPQKREIRFPTLKSWTSYPLVQCWYRRGINPEKITIFVLNMQVEIGYIE